MINYAIGFLVVIICILYFKMRKLGYRIYKLEYDIKNDVHNYNYVTSINIRDLIKRDRNYFESEITEICNEIKTRKK